MPGKSTPAPTPTPTALTTASTSGGLAQPTSTEEIQIVRQDSAHHHTCGGPAHDLLNHFGLQLVARAGALQGHSVR